MAAVLGWPERRGCPDVGNTEFGPSLWEANIRRIRKGWRQAGSSGMIAWRQSFVLITTSIVGFAT